MFFREEPAFRKLHNIEFSSRAQEEKFLKGLMEESKGYHLSNPKSVSTEWIVALCSNDKRNRQIYEGIDTLIGCVEFYKRSAEMKLPKFWRVPMNWALYRNCIPH